MKRKKGSLVKAFGIGLAILTAAGLASLWMANRQLKNLQLHEVTVPLLEPGTLPKGKESLRLLHISDLHMLDNQHWKQEWVNNLAQHKPDLVINTGDNLGEEQGVPGVLNAQEDLFDSPGAFIFGSNDYWGPKPVNPFGYLLKKKRKVSKDPLPWQGMRQSFLDKGWKDGTHQQHILPVGDLTVSIAGVDDPHHNLDNYAAIPRQAHSADADLKIGLTHSPEPYIVDNFSDDTYDLVLAGHTHGGQICLPGQKAIITNCGIDSERASGLHRWSEDTWLHVSNGLGNSKYVPFRVFCPPSATLIHITEK